MDQSNESGSGPKVGGLIDRSRYQYPKVSGHKTASGRPAMDNQDAIAVALRGTSLEDAFAAVEKNGMQVPDRWRTLNIGMARMAAGNALRKKLRAEGRIVKPDGTELVDPNWDPDARPRRKSKTEE